MDLDPGRLIDLTLPIRPDMRLYPGDEPPALHRLASIEAGNPLTLSALAMGCHVGTHVDAPAHFLAGAATVDQLDRRHFVGPATVLDLSGFGVIEATAVRALTTVPGRHLLLKTDNTPRPRTGPWEAPACTLSLAAAQALLDLRPLSIGFDDYSLDPPSADRFPAHRLVAQHGLPVFVCLDMGAVAAGDGTFMAFAPRVIGAEGLPVRAFLVPDRCPTP